MEFSREEIQAIVSLGATIGFIVAFNNFIVLKAGHLLIETDGIIMLLLCIFGMIVSVWLHEGGHKFFAEKIGYSTNTEPYYPGQVIGIVIAVFTFGYFPLFTPNTSDLEADPVKRMHKHRKYENFKQQAFIAASGLLLTAAMAILLQGAWIITGSQLLKNLLIGNVFLMFYSLVPFELLSLHLLRIQQKIDQLPESDGLYIFNYSFTAYLTALVFVVVLGIILLFTKSVPFWIAIFIALLVGVGAWFKFFLEGN